MSEVPLYTLGLQTVDRGLAVALGTYQTVRASYGRGFQVKGVNEFLVVPSSLGSGHGTLANTSCSHPRKQPRKRPEGLSPESPGQNLAVND